MKNKRVIVITLASVLTLLIAGGVLLLVFTCLLSNENYDKMMIKNLSQYSSIAMGTVGNSDTPCLMGIKEQNGKIPTAAVMSAVINADAEEYTSVIAEKIKFDDNGKEVEPKLRLIEMINYEKFLFLWYTNNSGNENFYYLVHKDSGKIYKLNFFDFVNTIYQWYSINDGVRGDCGDFIYMTTFSNNDRTVTKFSIENGLLKLEEWIKYDMLRTGFDIQFADKFGNLFIYNDYDKKGYIITKDKEVKEIIIDVNLGSWGNYEYNTFKGLNGYIYIKGQRINENGDLEDCDFVPFDRISKKNMLYKNGNKAYFQTTVSFFDEQTSKNITNEAVYKVEWINDEKYTVDTVIFENIKIKEDDNYTSYKAYYIGKYGFFYTTKASIIYRYELETGDFVEFNLTSSIEIEDIELYEADKIRFWGKDVKAMESVNGIVDITGKVSYNYTAPKYAIVYSAPLN